MNLGIEHVTPESPSYAVQLSRPAGCQPVTGLADEDWYPEG